MASRIDGYVLFVLLIQVAFTIVNATAIFPASESVSGFDEDRISTLKSQLEVQNDELDSILDYFSILGTIMRLGVNIITSLVLSLFSAVPTILKLFYMPDSIANALGYIVDVLVLLGLANMLLRRG